MSTHADFEDVLRLLEENRVDHMIVGGCAAAFHGFPRFTKDIEIFFADDRENLARLHAALVALGFQASTVSVDVLRRPDSVFSIGLEPVRIDLLNGIAGISFEEARRDTVRGRYRAVPVNFIGCGDLLRNKLATGRARDLGDVEELG